MELLGGVGIAAELDDMLALALENKRKSGLTNVEFLKGEIESIPLPDNSVDVIISNCVINLSADKSRVLREAFRVLKPGGTLTVIEGDHGSVYFHPESRPARRAIQCLIDLQARAGGELSMWKGCAAANGATPRHAF